LIKKPEYEDCFDVVQGCEAALNNIKTIFFFFA